MDADSSPKERDEQMFCEKCGMKMDDDAVFCPNCGATVEEENNAFVAKESEKSHKGLTVLIVIIAFLCVAAIGVAAMVIYREKSGSGEEEREISETDTVVQSDETDGSESVSLDDEQEDESTYYQKLDEINKAVDSYMGTSVYNGDCSFYYCASPEDGKDEEAWNSHASRAGASGRIFVIEYIVDAVGNGSMTGSDSILSIIRTTATGDEPSSHQLVETITGNFAEGLEMIDRFVEDKGYTDTTINRFNGDAGNHADTSPNQTSARDTGRSLMHIYQESKSGNEFASKVLQILCSESSSKAGIASSVRAVSPEASVYNFPGSYTACENDMAVIECDGQAIVISYMIGSLTESEETHTKAMQCMHDLTDIVWDKFIN